MHDGAVKIRRMSARACSLTYVRAETASILPDIRIKSCDVSIRPPPPTPPTPRFPLRCSRTFTWRSPGAHYKYSAERESSHVPSHPPSLPPCFLFRVTRFNCCPFARVVKYSFTGPNGAWRAEAQYKGPANLERSPARPIHHHTAEKRARTLLRGHGKGQQHHATAT